MMVNEKTTHETGNGETRIVSVDGPNLDAAAVAVLRDEFLPTVEKGRPLLLCVEEVEFVDSIGMSYLRRLRSLIGDDDFAIACVDDRLKYCLDRFPPAAWPNAYESLEEAQRVRARTGSYRVSISASETTRTEPIDERNDEGSVTPEESWEHQVT